ncbi:hypothetical protein BDZ91DRAFT_802833 [Kalaharituber pfeilii]|nr:hypothetical protein BDZ91DRAFT_802833 [Kalaharituber pfeilii]
MVYESLLLPIKVPNIHLRTFLFTSPKCSPLLNNPSSQLGSFISAAIDTPLPFFSLLQLTTNFSTALARLYSFREGSVLACFCQNSSWYAIAMWGAIRLRGVFCGNNPACTPDEMGYALRSGAEWVVAEEAGLERVLRVCEMAGIPEERVFLLESESGEGSAGKNKKLVGVRALYEIGKAFGESGQVPEFKLRDGTEDNRPHSLPPHFLPYQPHHHHPTTPVNGYDLAHLFRESIWRSASLDRGDHGFERRFPGVTLTQGYGMTETTACITATPWCLVEEHDEPIPKGTVGMVVLSTRVKIVDEDGRGVERGCEGEIRAQGPQCVTLGYLEGDWGRIDEKGWLFITDRVKEMIKVKGIPVAPAELEDCLLGHPNIADAAVIPVPHPYSDDVPRAYVVLKQSAHPAESKKLAEELAAYVRERKSRPKWITGGVKFVEEVPKSPSGKILRRVLRERARL